MEHFTQLCNFYKDKQIDETVISFSLEYKVHDFLNIVMVNGKALSMDKQPPLI